MRRSRRLLCSAVVTFLGCLPLSSTEIPIGGRVRDSGGIGLAGVRVELRPILSSYEQGLRDLAGQIVEPAARAVTGADGRFEVLAPGEGMWEVGVFGEGFVPQRFRLTPLTGAETLLPVKLRRDVGLRVRVEGPDGRPLAGARVVGRTRDEEPGWQTVPRIAVSGGDGVARLSCSREERLRLLATAPGFPVEEGPEVRGPAEASFRLAAGAPRRIEAPAEAILRDLRTSLVLGRGGEEVVTRVESWLLLETGEGAEVRFAVPERGGAVQVEVPAPAPLPGRVIDTETRQPIAGAWVWPRHDPGRFVRTDGQGAYRIQGNDLEIAAAGHLSEILDGSIPWPEGGLPPIALDPAVALIGTVVDGEGRPAAGAEVTVFPESLTLHPIPQERRAPRIGRVSALGEVRIAGLGPGGGYHVVVTGTGFAPVWLEEGRLKARENRFKAVLSRAGRVSGRIEDSQGRPVAEAEVEIEPGFGTARPSLHDDPARESERFTVTAPGGGFAFAEVPPGWYEMVVRRPGSAAQRLPRFEVRKGGGDADLGPLRLEEAEVLPVRVIDSEGRAVPGAEIWIGGGLGSKRGPAVVSGAAGGFALLASRRQALELIVCGPGFVPLEVNLGRSLPEETLVLTLRPGAAVSGRRIGADGLPLPGLFMEASPVAKPRGGVVHGCDGYGGAETDEAGRFRIAGLEPGLYTIGYEHRLALAAGEEREIAFPASKPSAPGAAVSGRVFGNDGLPVPGAWVSLGAVEDHGSYASVYTRASRTDADGNYRLEFPKPGLKIDSSSLGISRHGRTIVWSLMSGKGDKVLEADGRSDHRLADLPEPLEPAAEVELKNGLPEPGPLAANTAVTGRLLGLEPGELAGVKVTAGLLRGAGILTAGSVDAEGNYRVEGLPPESWWVQAEAADRAVFDAVLLPEGEARIVRDLVFPPAGEVYGLVETPESEPIAGATVTLRHEPGWFQMQRPAVVTRTGSDGWYRIRLPEGDYEVTASKEGFVPSAEAMGYATVEGGDADDATVWLRPAVELRGRLTGLPPDADELVIEAVLIDGGPGYRRRLPGKMTAEGRYVIPGLGPGTWEVEAVSHGIGRGRLEAVGEVVIAEEATEAALDLAFTDTRTNTD